MTRVFYSNKNPEQLENVMNNALDNIGNWLKANKLMHLMLKNKLNIIQHSKQFQIDQ